MTLVCVGNGVTPSTPAVPARIARQVGGIGQA